MGLLKKLFERGERHVWETIQGPTEATWYDDAAREKFCKTPRVEHCIGDSKHRWSGDKCTVCGKTRRVLIRFGCPQCEPWERPRLGNRREPCKPQKTMAISPYEKSEREVVCPYCGSSGDVNWDSTRHVAWTPDTGTLWWFIHHGDGSTSSYELVDCDHCSGRLTRYYWHCNPDYTSDKHTCRLCGWWAEV